MYLALCEAKAWVMDNVDGVCNRSDHGWLKEKS